MPLKINLDDYEFTLSDEALMAMAATLWHTKVKERGLMLCQEPTGVKRTAKEPYFETLYAEEITPGREHIGGRGSITERNCPNKVRVGHFHTHPSPGTAGPSWWDAYAIIAGSHSHNTPWLGCRGAKEPTVIDLGARGPQEEIQCQTVKRIPTLAEVSYLRSKRRKMRYTSAGDDPEIAKYLTEGYSFPARKVPEIIKAPVPVPVAPRIKAEELVFATSAFKKYTNLDTGETWTERIY